MEYLCEKLSMFFSAFLLRSLHIFISVQSIRIILLKCSNLNLVLHLNLVTVSQSYTTRWIHGLLALYCKESYYFTFVISEHNFCNIPKSFSLEACFMSLIIFYFILFPGLPKFRSWRSKLYCSKQLSPVNCVPLSDSFLFHLIWCITSYATNVCCD